MFGIYLSDIQTSVNMSMHFSPWLYPYQILHEVLFLKLFSIIYKQVFKIYNTMFSPLIILNWFFGMANLLFNEFHKIE